jgi:SnoaL-like protein
MARPRSIVDRSHEVFNARDFDAYPEVLDEHVELVIAGITFRGLTAVTDYLMAAAGTRPGLRVAGESVFAEGADTFVTEVRMVDTTDSGETPDTLEHSVCSLYRVAGVG